MRRAMSRRALGLLACLVAGAGRRRSDLQHHPVRVLEIERLLQPVVSSQNVTPAAASFLRQRSSALTEVSPEREMAHIARQTVGPGRLAPFRDTSTISRPVARGEEHHQPGIAAPVVAAIGIHQRKAQDVTPEGEARLRIPDRKDNMVDSQHGVPPKEP